MLRIGSALTLFRCVTICDKLTEDSTVALQSRITLSQGAVYRTLREGSTVTVDLKGQKPDNGEWGSVIFNGNKSIISVSEVSDLQNQFTSYLSIISGV